MEVLKAFKFRLVPKGDQEELLKQACGAARYAWNWTLGTCKDEYAAAVELAQAADDFVMVPDLTPQGKARTNEDGSPKMRKKWKVKSASMNDARLYKAFVEAHNIPETVKRNPPPDHPFLWLCNTHCHVYNYPVRNVVAAYKSWWRESAKGRNFGEPKFKVKGKSRDSFSIQIQGKSSGSTERRDQMKILKVSLRETNKSLRDKDLEDDARERLTASKERIDKDIEKLLATIRLESNQRAINARFFDDARRLKIPGIGWMKCRRDPQERIGEAIPLRVTVSRVADRWYASVAVSCEMDEAPAADHKPVIGVDLGINALVTLSDGTQVAPPQYLERSLHRLARLQRQLQRKKEKSERWKKAKMRISRLHAKIADARNDFLHKLSRRLVDGAKVIVVEGFDIQKLLQKVNRRSRRRQISDAAWGELRRQLEYKGQWYGAETLVRGEFDPTDMECHVCGTLNKMPPTTSKYRCSACRLSTTRQHNTAMLLKSFGGGGTPPEDDLRGNPGTDGQSETGPSRPNVRGLDGSAISLDEGRIQPGQTASADGSAYGSLPAPGGSDPTGSAGFLPSRRRTKRSVKPRKRRSSSKKQRRGKAA